MVRARELLLQEGDKVTLNPLGVSLVAEIDLRIYQDITGEAQNLSTKEAARQISPLEMKVTKIAMICKKNTAKGRIAFLTLQRVEGVETQYTFGGNRNIISLTPSLAATAAKRKVSAFFGK